VLHGAALSASADEACVDFKWDTVKEHALFAGRADPLTLGTDLQSAPMIVANHLYELQPVPQARVTFAVVPGTRNATPNANAGLATFTIPSSGSYRVSIDAPFWIDVVSNGARVAAKDFQGQHGCPPPHKIVEFDLQGVRPFILQLSNATAASVRLTVTPTPVRKL
jgi:transglutaminase-like putative cysteine protease